MFTWICPQCGREVPPAYTECPDCAAKSAAAEPPAAPPPGYPPPPPPGYPPPPPQYQHPGYPPPPGYPPQYPPYPQQPYPPQYPPYPYQQPVYGQPPYAAPPPGYPPPPPPPSKREDAPPAETRSTVAWDPAPPPPPAPEPLREPARGSALFGAPPAPVEQKQGMPTWLMTILFTAGFAVIVVGAYWIFGTHRTAATPSATVENPAATPGAAANPWQKFIEVSGVRFAEDPKHKGQTVVKFVVTNHSESELSNLAGNVTIWAGTKKSDEDAQGTFAFKTNIGAYDSKDLTVPFTTKLKVYELPDWNLINTDLQITSPNGGG